MKKVSKLKNNIVAVIVTYNRKELLKESIDALLNQEKNKCDILVIDNNSNDGTYDFISKYEKTGKIVYMNTGSNLGGAGGFNFGLRKACELGYDYVWIMDDDCIVHKDSLEKLLQFTKLKG